MVSGEWFSLQTVLFVGLVLKASGFLARDEMVLRALVVTGMCCDLAYYALQPEPILPSVMSNGILLAINIVVMGAIVLERTTLAMSPRERTLFHALATLTPGQFRKVSRLANYSCTSGPLRVIEEHMPVKRLYFVEGDGFRVEKGGQGASVQGPAFAGEIGLLTDAPASASVDLPANCDYVVWEIADLQRLMRRNPATRNALVARFATDLAGKVAQSVPNRAIRAAGE